MVSLSFIVPTAGRHELRECLLSLSIQMDPKDECLVVGDTLEGPLEWTEALVKTFGSQFRYIPFDAGEHAWGHPQINEGMRHAKGDYLSFSDDDDVWVPGAIKTIHERVDIYGRKTKPLLFRYLNYHGFLVWVEHLLYREDYIGGHCLVCPNTPDKLGIWTDRYAGDWDFVDQTINLQGGLNNVVWCKDVIVIARPNTDVSAEIYRIAAKQDGLMGTVRVR